MRRWGASVAGVVALALASWVSLSAEAQPPPAPPGPPPAPPPAAEADTLPGKGAVPPPVELPKVLTLQESVRVLKSRGLDLLIAGANVMSAEADVINAGAIANPNASVAVGGVLNYDANAPGCSGCSRLAVQWGISDNAALMDFIMGKRGLRVRAARAALAAARMGRTDAERTLTGQVKQQYVAVVLAKATLEFNKSVQDTMTKTLEINKLRYPRVIDEGALARVEIQKLEADQAVSTSTMSLRQAQIGLGFLLGVRSTTPDFDVEKQLLTFRVPAALASATERSLFELALNNRPDLKVLGYQRMRAEEALSLAKRTQIPDITLNVQYSQAGLGQTAASPATILFGASMNLPVLYQQQGEVRRARADLDTQSITHAKTVAQIANDLSIAFAAFKANRELVERMESTLLGRAKKARDILETQFHAGTATLMDFLDAQRTYIATNLEYLNDLTQYWTALYQLEQAVGVEDLK